MPADSFLSRWSKRKQESRAAESAPLREPDPAAGATSRSTLVTQVPPPAAADALPPPPAQPLPASTEKPGAPAAMAAPTELPPVESLTPESDFRPFMQPDVDPAVRNQAMKSLFRDPHFNVMDMMDVYVDDYSKPDPIPEGMLRQMTQSRMLKLFDDLPEEADEAATHRPGTPAGQGEDAAAADTSATAALPAPQSAEPAELGQKAPDTTICPTAATVNASEPQQQK